MERKPIYYKHMYEVLFLGGISLMDQKLARKCAQKNAQNRKNAIESATCLSVPSLNFGAIWNVNNRKECTHYIAIDFYFWQWSSYLEGSAIG